MAGGSLDWLWWVAGAVVGAGGLALLAWALFWDRARGRRRCPKCWYDMGGVPGMRCPECGRSAAAEARLHRHRRRWGWVMIGASVLVIGVQAGLQPRRAGEGWTSCVPTTVLAAVVRLDGGSGLAFADAAMRARWDGAWSWQRELVLGTDLWVTWVNTRGAIACRAVWPAGVPVTVRLTPWGNVYRTSGGGGRPGAACRLVSDASGASEAIRVCFPPGVFVCGNGYDPSPEFLRLPAQPPGVREVSFVLSVSGVGAEYERPLGRRTIRVPFRFVSHLDEAMKPLRTDAADAAVRRCVGLRLLPMEACRPSPLCVDLCRIELPAGTAMGATIEVLRGGEVVGTTEYREGIDWVPMVLCNMQPDACASLVASLPNGDWDTSDPRVADALRGWALRLTGSAKNSLTDFDATQYWAGQIELPLASILR